TAIVSHRGRRLRLFELPCRRRFLFDIGPLDDARPMLALWPRRDPRGNSRPTRADLWTLPRGSRPYRPPVARPRRGRSAGAVGVARVRDRARAGARRHGGGLPGAAPRDQPPPRPQGDATEGGGQP